MNRYYVRGARYYHEARSVTSKFSIAIGQDLTVHVLVISMPSPTSWLRLAHKTCIVTGAGSGIGRAVAASLVLEHRCRVVLVDHNFDALADVETEIINNISKTTGNQQR